MKKYTSTFVLAYVLLAIAIMLVGCSYTYTPTKSQSEIMADEMAKKEKEVMDSWIDGTKHELIKSWGPPTRTTSDGANGEILIYEVSVVFPSPYGKVIRMRMFNVNQYGKIYQYLCKGRFG